jgi:hypothetical protein
VDCAESTAKRSRRFSRVQATRRMVFVGPAARRESQSTAPAPSLELDAVLEFTHTYSCSTVKFRSTAVYTQASLLPGSIDHVASYGLEPRPIETAVFSLNPGSDLYGFACLAFNIFACAQNQHMYSILCSG